MNVQTAQHLAELRRTKGYSQEGLAQRLGLSRQAISKWERAESSPDTDNLIALAHLYNVSLDELIGVGPDTADDVVDEAVAASQESEQRRERAEQERQRERDRTEQALSAAAQASTAAAQAAQAAAAAAAEHRAETRRDFDPPQSSRRWNRRRRATLSTFPFSIVAIMLFFVLGFSTWHGFTWSWLVFFTIPVFRWIAGVIEDDLDRHDEEGSR